MATFEARVENMAGDIPSGFLLEEALQDGVTDVITRIRTINEGLLPLFSTYKEFTKSDIGTGNTIDTQDLLSVARYDGDRDATYIARPVTLDKIYLAGDSESIYAATATDPVYYVLNGYLNILPTLSSDNDAIRVWYVVAGNVNLNNNSIENFPDEMIPHVLTYGALQVMQAKMRAITAPTTPNLPSPPVVGSLEETTVAIPSFNGVGGFVPPSLPSDVDIDYSGLPDAPQYVIPVMESVSFTVPDDLAISVSLPVAPQLSSNTVSFNASLDSYSAPVFTVPTNNAVAPVFVQPVAPMFDYSVISTALSSVSMPAEAVLPTLDFNDFPSLTWNFPSAPTAPVLSSYSVTIGDLDTAPTFAKPVLTLPTLPSLDTLNPSAVDIEKFEQADIDADSVPTFVPPVLSIDTTDFDSAMAEDDTELAVAHMQKIQADIAKYQADITNAVQQFQSELAAFTADARESRYQVQIQQYAAVMSQEIAKWQASEIAGKLGGYQAELQGALTSYAHDIQNEMNRVQTELAEYNAKIQKALQQAQHDADMIKSGDAARIQAYNAEIQGYATEVNGVIQQNQALISAWQVESQTKTQKYASEVSALVNKYQADIARASGLTQNEIAQYSVQLQRAVQTNQLELEKYRAELEAAVAAYNRDVVEYQGELQKYLGEYGNAIQKYNIETQQALNTWNKSLNEYQAELQIAIQNANLQDSGDTHELQRYASELQAYQAEVSSAVTEYTTNLQKDLDVWKTQVQNALQRYSADIQNSTQEYSASLNTWKTLIDKAVTTYQAETGYDMTKYRSALDGAVASFTNDLNKANAEFQADLQKYQAESNVVQAKNASVIQKFSVESQKYMAEGQNIIQLFATELQKAAMEYQWLQAQYPILKAQYEQMFVPYQGVANAG